MVECLFTDCTFPASPVSAAAACGLHLVAIEREMAHCWRSGCHHSPVPAEQQSPRLRGRYCAPCQALTLSDADRIIAEFS